MPESHPMIGGDGTYSYTKNSYLQREGIKYAKGLIDETIAHKLDIKDLLSNSRSFKIADLGCSVGPNTFICMESVIQAVKHKFQSHGLTEQIPDFQVFFSDHTFNDFNTLFRSLPPERPYFAAGVPGSFHGRLFPESSVHFVHSSHALHWISQVPKEILDKSSPAWNKGRIYYTGAPDEVGKAYAIQFAKDVDIFLDARAKELVVGGMMVLILPGIHNGISHSCAVVNVMLDLLGSCLMDMCKEGLVSEAQVDSFNLPMYVPSPKEMIELVERNGSFKIERMELFDPVPGNEAQILRSGHAWKMHFRAGLEGVFSKHFASETIDELFDRFPNKAAEKLKATLTETTLLFIALKRK
ncbi:hypothetical protein P3X46_032849 [Hevea brasiliensis]|uniref:S-adenosylmethionine-dependent methyltransferase n=1 Tax=Hevea brasiliensis TaxID=3981 RepID=A0ABQ9KEL0_HEVBR|nr:loganic acid O-methyltransferase-like [Hevea brasiliensis]KAJ9135697.1 hypothetical protein P3X46_032849 [Hevea brasiliensis]